MWINLSLTRRELVKKHIICTQTLLPSQYFVKILGLARAKLLIKHFQLGPKDTSRPKHPEQTPSRVILQFVIKSNLIRSGWQRWDNKGGKQTGEHVLCVSCLRGGLLKCPLLKTWLHAGICAPSLWLSPDYSYTKKNVDPAKAKILCVDKVSNLGFGAKSGFKSDERSEEKIRKIFKKFEFLEMFLQLKTKMH